MPNMGMKHSSKPSRRVGAGARSPGAQTPISMAGALFTNTQQRVLGLLFGQPERSFVVTELIAMTGAGSGAVQRELARLTGSGLLTTRKLGNQKHYQANPSAPIHAELVGIMQKTTGLTEPLREALAPLSTNIVVAFVYGSVAKRSDNAASDIDLMIVSDKLGYADVFGALEPATVRLGRTVNPTVYTRAELAKRIVDGNAFVSRVMEQPKLWLIGSDHALTA